jgi:hypothetical protein
MNTHNRVGKRWSVNEVLALQREFELLDWSIDQIAEKHQRTPNGIMFKLDQEGFADYNVLYSNYHDLNSEMPVSHTSKYDAFELEAVDSEDEDTVLDENDEDYEDEGDEEDNDDEEDEDDDPLAKRVTNLELCINEIRDMLKSLTVKNEPSCGISKCKMSSCV